MRAAAEELTVKQLPTASGRADTIAGLLTFLVSRACASGDFPSSVFLLQGYQYGDSTHEPQNAVTDVPTRGCSDTTSATDCAGSGHDLGGGGGGCCLRGETGLFACSQHKYPISSIMP